MSHCCLGPCIGFMSHSEWNPKPFSWRMRSSMIMYPSSHLYPFADCLLHPHNSDHMGLLVPQACQAQTTPHLPSSCDSVLRIFSVTLVSPYLRGLSQTRREEGKGRYKSLAFSWFPESHSMASASISLSCFSCKSSMEMLSFTWTDYTYPKYSLCLWDGEERMWTGSQHYLPCMCFRGSVSSHMFLVKYF